MTYRSTNSYLSQLTGVSSSFNTSSINTANAFAGAVTCVYDTVGSLTGTIALQVGVSVTTKSDDDPVGWKDLATATIDSTGVVHFDLGTNIGANRLRIAVTVTGGNASTFDIAYNLKG